MIIDHTHHDTKSLQSVRATCKLLKILSEKHFCQSFLTHLRVTQTHKAFNTLLWTAQIPELAANIQSVNVTYDNMNPSLSGALCPGMWVEGEVDLLLRTLKHFHHIGKQITLVVSIAKTPLDNTSSIISIMYQVLAYILFCHGAEGVKTLVLDFDDTTSDAYQVQNTLLESRAFAKDYGPEYQRVWACIRQLKTLEQVRIRFNKQDEKTSPR